MYEKLCCMRLQDVHNVNVFMREEFFLVNLVCSCLGCIHICLCVAGSGGFKCVEFLGGGFKYGWGLGDEWVNGVTWLAILEF